MTKTFVKNIAIAFERKAFRPILASAHALVFASLLCLIGAQALAQDFSMQYFPDIEDSDWRGLPAEERYQEHKVSGSRVLLVTHNERFWDRDRLTLPALEKVAQEFIAEGSPVVTFFSPTADDALAPNYFYQGFEQSLKVPYLGDYHRVVVDAESITMTGNFFELCFCNSFRSALIQSKNLKEVRFVLPAMLGGSPRAQGLGSIARKLTLLSSKNTLDKVFAALSDEELFLYLQKAFFRDSDQGIPKCNNRSARIETDRRFSIELFRGERPLGIIGNGDEKIRLFLVE